MKTMILLLAVPFIKFCKALFCVSCFCAACVWVSVSNLHYTRGITPKRVTSDGTHIRTLGTQLRRNSVESGKPLTTLRPI